MRAAGDRIAAIDTPALHGFLHEPEAATGAGLVLTHGAGSDCNAPLLLATAAAFSARGVAVLRCDLAFRRRRAKGPPSPTTAAADRDTLRAASAMLRSRVSGPVFLGGHSYGGRQASMLVAEEPGVAGALLLLSYPLHPPEKPTQLRSGHLPRLCVSSLFVSGTRDPFATLAELEAAIAAIAAPTRLVAVDGAGHDLKRGRFDLDRVVTALGELAR